MRTAVVEKPYEVAIRDIDPPRLKQDEVLVRVMSTGICGTDLHGFQGEDPRKPPPVILGHECAGLIAETGTAATRFSKGDRVVVLPLITCGYCPQCLSGRTHLCDNRINLGSQKWAGAFAEYVQIPESLVYPLPERLSYDAATLVEPLSVSVHAVRTAGIHLGESVLVVGCGAIGLTTVLAARAAGASTIIATDVRDFNLQKAKDLGATHTVNVRSQDVVGLAGELTGGRGVDRTLLAVDAEGVLEEAINSTRKSGSIVLIAMFSHPVTVNLYLARRGEQHITGSLACDAGDFQTALALVDSHRVVLESLITHRFPLEEMRRAFDLLETRAEDVVKVVIRP